MVVTDDTCDEAANAIMNVFEAFLNRRALYMDEDEWNEGYEALVEYLRKQFQSNGYVNHN